MEMPVSNRSRFAQTESTLPGTGAVLKTRVLARHYVVRMATILLYLSRYRSRYRRIPVTAAEDSLHTRKGLMQAAVHTRKAHWWFIRTVSRGREAVERSGENALVQYPDPKASVDEGKPRHVYAQSGCRRGNSGECGTEHMKTS